LGENLKADNNIPHRLVQKMDYSTIAKPIGRIAIGFGIVFIIFSAFSAFITYQALSLSQTSYYISSGVLQVNILNAMLPYLLYAALSFIVAGFTLPYARKHATETPPVTEPDPEMQSTEPQEEPITE
jgi:hypothetical protein